MTMQRMQFELTANQVKDIENLMEKLGITTKRELFNNALAILEWACDERSNDRTVGSLDEKSKSYKELYMPIFGAIARVK